MDDAAAVRYDRQIRLWGSTTQRVLQATKLVIGPGAAGAEAAKNLVLGGVGHVVLYDPAPVSEADINSSCLFLPQDVEAGRRQDVAACARLKALNPLVSVKTVDGPGEFRHEVETPGDVGAPVFVLLGNATATDMANLLRDVVSRGHQRTVINVFSPTSSESLVFVAASAHEALAPVDVGGNAGAFVSRRPAATQRALLQYHLWDAAAATITGPSYAARLAVTLDARDALDAALVSDEVLEAEVLAERPHGAVMSVLQNSVVGGIVCQQIIARITKMAVDEDTRDGKKAQAPAVGTLFEWAHISKGQCLVGAISD